LLPWPIHRLDRLRLQAVDELDLPGQRLLHRPEGVHVAGRAHLHGGEVRLAGDRVEVLERRRDRLSRAPMPRLKASTRLYSKAITSTSSR
jgi:hypothetical protein